ncbi:MAG: formylglycine-generating enzyme family protein [Planctomycetes bacterium]|nr:formylglycine-generating enzyme family protein [Planctomycetota bacterium]
MRERRWGFRQARWAAAALALWAPPAAVGGGAALKEVFAADFSKGMASDWRMVGGKWVLKDGLLCMTDAGTSDPTKALILVGERHQVSAEVEITARLRLDAWAGDDYARAGVGVCADPTTAHGLNLVFHQGKLQFVHDYVAWGPGCDFAFKVGEWYWVKLYKAAAELKGKAWRDGQPEPPDWMVSWHKPDGRATGYPALVGASASPDKRLSAVSFAHCTVKIAEGPFGYYKKLATWHETLAASREALARQEAELAGKMTEVPGAPKLRRDGLWESLLRDFSDSESQQQMTAERADTIWAEDWPFDKPSALAERYAAATRAGLAARARELAKGVQKLSDIEPLRQLYHRAREFERSLAQWAPKIESLRLAVEDLTRTFGARYPKGPEYLRRLAELRDAIAAAHKPEGQPANAERLLEAVEQFESLRREALLANPLVDFDRLLLVKRKDARSFRPLPAFRVQGIGSGPENHINGLPVNFQGNGVLRQVPIENEIAVMSLGGTGLRPVSATGGTPVPPTPVPPTPAPPTPALGGTGLRPVATLYRPEKPAYVGDLKLHFDGDRLLFSSIGSHERFQIFELQFVVRPSGRPGDDGLKPALQTSVRQVTRGEEEDVDNYDSCYLPDGRIIFGSSAPFQSVPCQRRWDEVANLFVMNADGSGVRRLCFDQDHDFYPTMMSDGRVLYTRWEYTDIAHAFSARLFTMNPDGTAQRAYYASSSFWPNRIFYAKPIPDCPTKFVGIITGHHGVARAGELILFDVTKGRRQADGAIQRIPGWGKKVEPVLRDALVDASWPKFLHPHPLSDKYLLVACQPTGGSWWGIYLVDVFDNMLLLREEPGWMLLEPTPLRKTPRPPVIPDRVDPQAKEATVYLTDIYAGEGLRGIPRGTVKKLRLFTYHFNYFGTSGIEDYLGMDGPWDVRRVVGTVPVADDGSAYFVVPANTPLALQPLDAEGKALQLMRSWFTAMPGEAVSCIGCHEETNSSPPVLRPTALGAQPARITPWHGPVRGFSWDREVQPVLDKYCVGCHNGQPQPGVAPGGTGLRPVSPTGGTPVPPTTVPPTSALGGTGLRPVSPTGGTPVPPTTVPPTSALGGTGLRPVSPTGGTPVPPTTVPPTPALGGTGLRPVSPTGGTPVPPTTVPPTPALGGTGLRPVSPTGGTPVPPTTVPPTPALGGTGLRPVALDLRRAAPRTFPLSSAAFPPSFYALRRLVRSPGLEGDPRVLPPADYHADTNPLVRMLRQGHHGVKLDAEAWDRLVTWLDMNAPAYGTWLEVPSVKGNQSVRKCSERRRALLKQYAGLDDDPEAVSEVAGKPSESPVPRPASRVPEHPMVSGWPFDEAEARRRQGSADTEMEVELGTGVKLRLVRIPAGEFIMGDAAGCDNERPLCKVKIERPFWLGKFEVTNEQFRCFDPAHQSGLEPMLWLKWSWEDYADLGQPRQPVCRVSWDQATAFCRWLSEKAGKAFSLPTEAQWEWACRAGSDTALSFGPLGADSAPFANLADAALLGLSKWPRTQVGFARTERVKQFYLVDSVDDGQHVSAPVGSFKPNAWGLHDMHGNVAEWTRSECRPYRSDRSNRSNESNDSNESNQSNQSRQSDRSDPLAPRRAVRGGSWFDRAALARSAARASYWPWQRVFDVGFRVACDGDR